MLSVFRLILIGVFIALFKNERYLLSFLFIFSRSERIFWTVGLRGATIGSQTPAKFSIRWRTS